jgi:hypothetical protein
VSWCLPARRTILWQAVVAIKGLDEKLQAINRLKTEIPESALDKV